MLGVLVITTEYSTGVIRSSLLAVPKRLPMLAAKVAVFAILIVILGEIVAFTCFFLGSAILHSKVPVTLSDQNVLRAVLGAGLYLAVLGVFALAVGSLIRHTAAGITTVIGIVLVLPILSGLLPSSWGAHINAYLPEQAGALVYQRTPAGRASCCPPGRASACSACGPRCCSRPAPTCCSAATPDRRQPPPGRQRRSAAWRPAARSARWAWTASRASYWRRTSARSGASGTDSSLAWMIMAAWSSSTRR